MNNSININYPRTEFDVLNIKIKYVLQKYIDIFLLTTKNSVNLYNYTLNINYDKEEKDNKIYIYFYISIYKGENDYIYNKETIIYDIYNDNIIEKK